MKLALNAWPVLTGYGRFDSMLSIFHLLMG